MNPKLSIIIPVLNNLKGLQKTMKSIENQNFKNFEVLIIDGQSNQETQAFLQTLKAPYFYQSKKDISIYDAMNTGVLQAKGEWLYFLGTGDLLFDNTILEQVFKNASEEKNNIIAGNIIYKGTTKPFIYSKNKTLKTASWNFAMWIRNGIHHQGTFYRKNLFETQKYSLQYYILSDYWFNLKLYKNGEKCTSLPITIAICDSDGVSKSGKWEIYQEEINLKTALSSILLSPIFYVIAFSKYAIRKIVNN